MEAIQSESDMITSHQAIIEDFQSVVQLKDNFFK